MVVAGEFERVVVVDASLTLSTKMDEALAEKSPFPA